MVDKIEMSLDDIIKSNRGQKQKAGGKVTAQQRKLGKRNAGAAKSGPLRKAGGVLKGRNRVGSIQKAKITRGDVNSAWKHDMYDGPRRSGGILKAANTLTKLLVSNLDYGVSDVDIHELFAEFGTIKKASIHYDRSGRSVGTAEVVFERRPDAIKAIKQYNGVPLDGRPMKIELATSDMSTIVGSGRLGVAPVAGPGPSRRKQRGIEMPQSKRGGIGGQRRGAVNRGKAPGTSGPGRRSGNRAVKGTTKTAEELDAELDAYVNDMKI